MAGYTRQSAASIVPTAVVRATPLNDEFNALRDAFVVASGHKHDGTTAEGAYVPLISDTNSRNKLAVDPTNNRLSLFVNVSGAAAEQLRFADGVILPVVDNDIDLGSPTFEFKDIYIDGTANIDSLIADTASIAAGSINNTVIGNSTPAAGTFTSITANVSATLASAAISGGTINNTVIGGTTPAAATFTNLTVNTAATIASAAISAGTINNTVIGGTTAAAITGTTITANTGFSGNLTGNVTGNVTASSGTSTFNNATVNGTLTGTLTGNVSASSGTSTFNNVTITGTLNMDAGTAGTITNLSTPTNSGDAATKGYVDTAISNLIGTAPGTLDTLGEIADALNDDANIAATLTNQIATKVSKSGDSMTGALAMGTNKITGLGDPTNPQDAATKTYVDTQRDTRLALSGGTMTGAIAMGTNKITGLGDPTSNQDAATKVYVDGILGSATSAAASAAAAATSASNAATSASNASTSASNAATSASNAASSASAAAASYDSFDDRYLGAKSSAPTLDNDGNALLEGAFYWDSVVKKMFVWSGTAWVQSTLAVNDFIQYVAPGTVGNVLTSNGTVWTSAPASGGSTNVQEFSSSATWTKPAGVSSVLVELWGAGGGGGSGSVGISSYVIGGSGGAGGGYNYRVYKASDVPSSLTITIGAGGAGGAAVGTSSTNGNAGTSGGTTSFGSLLFAYGGFGGAAGLVGATSALAGGGGGGSLSAGTASAGGSPLTVSTSSTFNVFGGGSPTTGIPQPSIYGGSAGGGFASGSLTYYGAQSIYGGGGGGCGTTFASNALVSFSGTNNTNAFGSNALGGSGSIYVNSNSPFPAVISSTLYFVSRTGLISYTSDGTNFTNQISIPNCNGRLISDGTYFYITTDAGVYRSTNLTTWTAVTMPITAVWRNSIYAGGRYIFVGFASGSAAIAVSTDLVSWNTYAITGSDNSWTDIQFDGTNYVICGGTTTGRVAYSSNGSTWTLATNPSVGASTISLAVNGSTWCVVADGSAVRRTTDSGATWTSVYTSSRLVPQISYVSGKFVVLANGSSFQLWHSESTDGITWTTETQKAGAPFGTGKRAIALGSDFFIAGASQPIKTESTFTTLAFITSFTTGTNGGVGGNGLTASGGAGGGAAVTGFTSGAGGSGGNGFARITAW